MVKPNINLQDSFLNQARRESMHISITLVSGGKLEGRVEGFDNFTVIVKDDSQQRHLVYKHAISTISPLQQDSGSAPRNSGGGNQQREKPGKAFNTTLRDGLKELRNT